MSQQVKKTLEDEESESNWPVTQVSRRPSFADVTCSLPQYAACMWRLKSGRLVGLLMPVSIIGWVGCAAAQQIIIDNDLGSLPTGNARALATAILGAGPGMVGGPYKLLNTIRIWRCTLGNEATAALVRREGGREHRPTTGMTLLGDLCSPPLH